MTLLLVLIGIVLVVTTLVDVFCSLVRTPLRAGPFTTFGERIVCRGLYRLFRRTGRRNVLASIGPASVAARAFMVLLGLFAGWSAILFADPTWVVLSKTGEPAGSWERLYFVGYSISTLGLGDVVPNAVPARLATVGASLTGFTVITFVVGSISPLSDVIADRNAVAALMIAHEDARKAGASAKSVLDDTLDQIASPLIRLANAVETLPVQHRMHAERERYALSVALDRLCGAIESEGTKTDVRCVAALNAVDRILTVLCTDWLRGVEGDRTARLTAFRIADHLPRSGEDATIR